MTAKERVNLEVVANDVKWMVGQMKEDCTRIGRLEKLVYVGLGICISASTVLAFIK